MNKTKSELYILYAPEIVNAIKIINLAAISGDIMTCAAVSKDIIDLLPEEIKGE